MRHFFTYVPGSRRVPTLWVNSVYMVVALATVFSVVLPQSSDFVWLFYRVYLGMAMGYFVDLTLAWYGGESEMLRHIGEGKEINFRVRPCCFCLICPKATPFNRQKIRFFRGAVYQVSILPTFYEQLFCTKDFRAAFMYLHCRFKLFRRKEIGAKAARKMLVKLTTGKHFHKDGLLHDVGIELS